MLFFETNFCVLRERGCRRRVWRSAGATGPFAGHLADYGNAKLQSKFHIPYFAGFLFQKSAICRLSVPPVPGTENSTPGTEKPIPGIENSTLGTEKPIPGIGPQKQPIEKTATGIDTEGCPGRPARYFSKC